MHASATPINEYDRTPIYLIVPMSRVRCICRDKKWAVGTLEAVGNDDEEDEEEKAAGDGDSGLQLETGRSKSKSKSKSKSNIRNNVGINIFLDRTSMPFKSSKDWGNIRWRTYQCFSSPTDNEYCEIEVINESRFRILFW